MKIEVGEYVRIKSGKIDIFKEKDENYMFARCEKNTYWILDIINHSKNIIDLIEVGDYVNGYKVIAKSDDGYIEILTEDIEQGELLEEQDIKTILTKELYKANCYRVERKEEWRLRN